MKRSIWRAFRLKPTTGEPSLEGASIDFTIRVAHWGTAEYLKPPGSDPGNATKPEWMGIYSSLSAKAFEEVQPREASRKGQVGRVELTCQVGPHGALNDCSVGLEEPVGWDFGGAAIRMSKIANAASETYDRKSTEGYRVMIPFIFVYEGMDRPIHMPNDSYW